ncbi:hypothetical protein JRO89_XS14G0089100 [Xanthoceras sorbifolium]|uniref:Uncharacterized protein n=1 Tax=Xanthoceras sorbifolium TaxID=99658 RepID=A0ABQ8H4K0_9ROSI|nr:hypothetical protein JRO89_XS14G0089100 [Xanthoceras sorbifolium]
MRFTINGHSYFNLVVITNVAGAGMCILIQSKGPKLAEQFLPEWPKPLISDGRTLSSYNAAPANWQYGQTFEGVICERAGEAWPFRSSSSSPKISKTDSLEMFVQTANSPARRRRW